MTVVPSQPHTRIILIDGRSGSGKTTFAADLARRLGADVLHMDELYPGWDGLATGASTAAEIVRCLATGKAATWRVWDWHRSGWGAECSRQPGGTLIVEGCGSLTFDSARYCSERYWLAADQALRRIRALTRDQDISWWDRWQGQEDRFYALHQPWLLASRVITAHG